MSGRRGFLFLFLFLAVLGAAAGTLWHFRDPLLERTLEKSLNALYADFFAGSLELEDVHLDESFKLSIGTLHGNWQTADRVFPVEIRDIRVQDSVFNFLLRRPVRLTFDSLRPRHSPHPGVRGEARLIPAAGTFTLDADFLGLYLEELVALDPEHLKGSSGALKGHFHLLVPAEGEPEFELKLRIEEPGGRLQARFFDLLLPYLPAADRTALESIGGLKTVKYRKADLNVALAGAETVNVLLSIAVPDYNLNLNLNLKILVESGEVFAKLAELLGLLQGKK